MPRCPYCRTSLYESREQMGARCPSCREPLYERPVDEERVARLGGGNLCAVHTQSAATGTCQRCGNYMCPVCRTRWRGQTFCIACVERSLASGEAAPEEERTHLRQSALGLIFGIAAWVVALLGCIVMVAGFEGGPGEANVVLVAFGVIIFLASPLLGVLGIGQSAAAIRTRGNHMILATAALILCGLNIAVVIGLFALSFWQG